MRSAPSLRRPLARLCLAALIVALGLASGCPDPCDVDRHVADRLAPDSVDCGRVAIGGDPAEAEECAAEAFLAGVPYQLEVDRVDLTLDAEVREFQVRTAAGEQLTFLYVPEIPGQLVRLDVFVHTQCEVRTRDTGRYVFCPDSVRTEQLCGSAD